MFFLKNYYKKKTIQVKSNQKVTGLKKLIMGIFTETKEI